MLCGNCRDRFSVRIRRRIFAPAIANAMHIHHYTLKKLAGIIEAMRPDCFLVEAFTQERDQIVLGFGNPEGDLYLRIGCAAPLPYIWPVRKFGKARKNVKDIFPQLYGQKITGVEVVDYERVVVIHLENECDLVLKMHGLLSNVLVMEGGKVTDRFRHHHDPDLEFTVAPGHYQHDWEDHLAATEGQKTLDRLRAISPIYDKQFAAWVDRRLQEGHSFAEAYGAVRAAAGQDAFYIVKEARRIRFLILPPDDPEALQFDNLEQALSAFFRSWYQYESYARHHAQVSKALNKHLKRYRGQIDSHYKSMDSIESTRPPEEFGHILMANLHQLPTGMKAAELYDFYQDQPIKIKLKPDLNPQQNAEYYYNKQKKLRSRMNHLEEQIDRLEGEQSAFLAIQEAFEELPAPPEVKLGERGMDYELTKRMAAFAKQHYDLLQAGKPRLADRKHPFHEYRLRGWTIFVGKNAKQNDLLTFQHSRKTDLWLHARDATGSHVILRNPNGRDVPNDVLEFAAGLAAQFSKRKREALVPVQYTERKYVRKMKNGRPGQVIVEREKVVMVEPQAGKAAQIQ